MTRTEPLRLVALSAGVRAPSSTRALSDAVLGAVGDLLAVRGETTTTRTVEVREHAMDATSALLDGRRSPALTEAVDAVETADVLVVATPVYNGSYSGLFKAFLDVVDPNALAGKVVVLAATGGSVRHSLVIDHKLRPLFAFLQAAAVPTGVFAAPEDWLAPGQPDAALTVRITQAAAEAVRFAYANSAALAG